MESLASTLCELPSAREGGKLLVKPLALKGRADLSSEGEPDGEAGASEGAGVDSDRPVVRGDELLADRQT